MNKFFLVIFLLWSVITTATEPVPPKITLDVALVGRIVHFRMTNNEKIPVQVSLYPGEHSSILFPNLKAVLQAGQSTDLQSDARTSDGLQVLDVRSKVSNDKFGEVPGPQVYQPFMVTPNGGSPLSYEKAFLGRRLAFREQSEPAKIDLGGGAIYSAGINPYYFKSNVVPADGKISPVKARSPLEYAKMPLHQLPRVTEPSAGGRHDGTNSTLEEMLQVPELETNYVSNDVLSPMATATFKGHLSLKVSPSAYKSAWGWVVRVWQKPGASWVFLGWAYVAGDGSWQVVSTSATPGAQTWIEYQTKNRFVSLQDPAGNPYTWGDSWTLSGAMLDVGYRYADLTVTGDLPGVDKLYVGATNIWVKFYNNGMNALRDQPVQVTFPNSLASGQCVYNDGAGPYAWSCSYWADGRIYVIPAHASVSVVQHEIGHSINSYYWSGSMPPGAGGSHNLWDCYNPGLALTEGWANFLTYWVQFDRNTSNPVAPYFNMNIESLPAGVCANQNAEMRTAATFWDTYDYWNDGSDSATTYDSLLYTNQAVPVSIYLNNKRNTPADYLAVMQSGQSAYWQGEFTKLFRLNKIIP
ncbi:MAG: hypothetical protein ACKOX6_11585 [Bdellovibrio sp.]